MLDHSHRNQSNSKKLLSKLNEEEKFNRFKSRDPTGSRISSNMMMNEHRAVDYINGQFFGQTPKPMAANSSKKKSKVTLKSNSVN